MAACLSAPWPSQQRAGRGGQSERHSALARMKERHARAERLTPDEEPPPRKPQRLMQDDEELAPRKPQQPRPPAQPRGGDARPAPRPGSLGGSGQDLGSSGRAEPWAPAWSPDSPHNDDDLDTPPPKPQRPVAPGEKAAAPPAARAPRAERPSESSDGNSRSMRSDRDRPSDDGDSRSSRVRGPAEVRTARTTEAEDECLPPGAQGADFKTLQAMIQKGIQDAETGAVKLEKDIPPLNPGGEDEEERRYKERQRLKREQEAADREKEREKAKQKRRRENEERERRMAEELEREEQEELSHREARARAEDQCRREVAAAMKIQSRVRGGRSRAGKPALAPRGLKAVVHWEPWMKMA